MCFNHGILHGLQENLCFDTWTVSTSSSSTDLGTCRIDSPTFVSLPPPTSCCTVFDPFLNISLNKGTTNVTDQLVFGQWRVCFGDDCQRLCPNGSSS